MGLHLPDARITNQMGLISSYSLDFSGQYDNGNHIQ